MPDVRCPAALSAYLGAVVDALAQRCVDVAAVLVPVAGPQQALSGSLDLPRALARPGLGRGPIAAVWHEELGWWAEPGPGPGPGPALPAGGLPRGRGALPDAGCGLPGRAGPR